MARWRNLSRREKKQYGSKSAFKAAKRNNRRGGGGGGNRAVAREVNKRRSKRGGGNSNSAPNFKKKRRQARNPNARPERMQKRRTVRTVPIEGRGSRGNASRGRRRAPKPYALTPEARKNMNRARDREVGRASKVSNINDYDTTSFGRGARKAADKLSRADLKELLRQGFGKQEIIDYSARKVSGGTKQGDKARSLLERWKLDLTPPKQEQAPAQQEAPKLAKQRPQNVTQTINSGGGSRPEGGNQINDGVFKPNPIDVFKPDPIDIFRPIDPVRPSPGQLPTAPPNRGPVNQEANVDQKNEQNFEVNQDNDVNTNITGDGNTVNVNQDNSVRQYGGNQRNFTYISQGANQAYSPDTPVSAATMAGYYEPDDSPAAQAKFVDMYSTLNSDNQKKYANSAQNVSNKYKSNARSNHPFDIRALDNRIAQRPLYHRSKANVQHSYMFGDYGNRRTPDWEKSTNPGAVKGPDFESIYDKTVDDINRIKI